MTNLACPECGAEMRQKRRGAALKKHGPLYICPKGERERFMDLRLPRKHEIGPRTWTLGELKEGRP